MRNRLFRLVSVLLIIGMMSTLCLVACGGGSSNPNAASAGKNIKDISAIVDDLPVGDDGKFDPMLLENVQLNLWTVIGQPDLETLEALIKEFNKQYAGMIEIKVTAVGHTEFYSALDTTYVNDYANFPDICLMHNEKNTEYALKGYFYPVDELISKTGVNIDFANAYDNIEKTTIYDGMHYGIPVDAHGYMTQIRQDIIKKNGLGFDGNTRFVPQSREEFQTLLVGLRELADSGELWVRHIGLDQDHSWYQLKNGNPNLSSALLVTSSDFYPMFFHSQESDNLSALYVNGGSLVDANGKVAFQNNAGFVQYLTDHVERYNSGLYGDAGNKEADRKTHV